MSGARHLRDLCKSTIGGEMSAGHGSPTGRRLEMTEDKDPQAEPAPREDVEGQAVRKRTVDEDDSQGQRLRKRGLDEDDTEGHRLI